METFFDIFTGICVAIYMVGFFIKNFVTAKNTGQPVKANSWKVNVLTVNISLLYILTYISIVFNPEFLIKLPDIFILKTAGAVLIFASLILGTATLVNMKNSWRMGITEKQNTELITIGLFRYSRNPYFLSYYMIFLGVFMIYPTLIFLLLYLPFTVLTHSMVLDEEKFLETQHGNRYSGYKNTVGRYFGKRFI